MIDSFAAVCLPSLLDELDNRFTGARIAAMVDTSHKLADQLSRAAGYSGPAYAPPSHDNVALELLGRSRESTKSGKFALLTNVSDCSSVQASALLLGSNQGVVVFLGWRSLSDARECIRRE